MRNFVNEVNTLKTTVIEGHVFDGKHLDALGRLLVQTTLRRYFWFDAIATELLEKPLPRKHRDLHLLIMIGLCAIETLNQPQHTSVNAAVETAKRLNKRWASSLTNATLRRYLRDREKIQNRVIDPVAVHNHPAWILDHLRADFPQESSAVILANNYPGPLSLRVNRLKQSRSAYLNRLKTAGLNAELSNLSPQGLYFENPVPISRLPGFQDGAVSIQDEGAQLAALLLDPQPGERILDACSAPGGKSCHLLELEPTIILTSTDIDPDRLEQVRDNFDRLGVNGEISCLDLGLDQPQLGTFDKILLDVPCSASGVIRRHPDIKLLRRATDLEGLIKKQGQFLTSVWDRLRPGGILLYATCSIFSDENEGVVSQFLQTREDAAILPLPEVGVPRAFGVQLLPTQNAHDGFYYALLIKASTGS